MKKIAFLLFIVLSVVGTQSFAQNPNMKRMKVSGDNLSKRLDQMPQEENENPVKAQKSSGVLVLVAHPDLQNSTANKALMEVASSMEKVTVKDLYADKKFDVDAYTELVENASAIVFQFPFYYASAPSQMKKWIDDVLYMFNKNILKNKPLLVVTTTGSEEEAYHSGARNQFTMDELLRPYQFTALHSGMVWQAPLVVYGMSTSKAEKNLADGCKEYRHRLEALLKVKVAAPRNHDGKEGHKEAKPDEIHFGGEAHTAPKAGDKKQKPAMR